MTGKFRLGGGLIALLVLLPSFAIAQDVSIDLGDQGALSTRTIQLFALITVLSLAPGIAIMVTCFPFFGYGSIDTKASNWASAIST